MVEPLRITFVTTHYNRKFTEETRTSLHSLLDSFEYPNVDSIIADLEKAINDVYHEEYENWNGDQAAAFIKKSFQGEHEDDIERLMVITIFEEVQQHWGLHLFPEPTIQ
jgi:hypothetical protein